MPLVPIVASIVVACGGSTAHSEPAMPSEVDVVKQGQYEIWEGETAEYWVLGSQRDYDALLEDIVALIEPSGWNILPPYPHMEADTSWLAQSPDGERCWKYRDLAADDPFTQGTMRDLLASDSQAFDGLDDYPSAMLVLSYGCV
jgi:hypothetical protein